MRKIVSGILLLVVFLNFSYGCGKNQLDGPENIVFLDSELREYLKDARTGKEDLGSLYREIVLKPIGPEFVMVSEGSRHLQPITNLEALKESINILTREDVISIVEDALKGCSAYLPDVKPTVYLLPSVDDLTKYGTGAIDGYADLTRGYMVLEVNTYNPCWKESLSWTVAHEYHHLAYAKHCPYPEPTLLERLIMEGGAESFAEVVNPELIAHRVTSNKYTQTVLDYTMQHLESTDPTIIYQVMEGWGPVGYLIGYQIVQEFITNNPEVTVEEWTALPAKTILDKSNFNWLADNN